MRFAAAMAVLVGLVQTAAQPAVAAAAAKETLWRLHTTRGDARRLRQDVPEGLRRIQRGLSVEFNVGILDWEAMQDDDGLLDLPLLLPSGEEVLFRLTRTHVMSPALAVKYPEIRTYSGNSVGFERHLTADVDYSPGKGFHAFIRDIDDEYYIDPFDLTANEYKVYSGRDVLRAEDFSCGVGNENHPDYAELLDIQRRIDAELNSRPLPRPEARGDPEKAKIYKLTLALISNGQYSAYHGNEVELVLAAMVTVMNRVNGIYKREMGIFFELHPQTDTMICLSPCPDLSNDSGILKQMLSFLDGRNVQRGTYDLGHSFTTGSGGMAYRNSFCTYHRAGGTTGLPNPTGDVFTVDYVSHEIGHQMDGRHSFSDCNGHFEKTSTPVEAGSGTTIMGYAGICGPTNIQRNSEPMFHSKNLEEMMDAVRDRIFTGGYCGQMTELTDSAPTVPVVETCDVPVGNAFQLHALKPKQDHFYTFEPVDKYLSRPVYLDRNVHRFRSWMPTPRSFRSFPSMYTLVHNKEDTVFDEILPTASMDLTFRTTVRTHFSTTEESEDGVGTVGFGMHAFNDTTVRFMGAMDPLRITQVPSRMETGKEVTIKWNVGGTAALSPKVQILAVEHNPAMDSTSSFSYTTNEADLDWRLIAEVPNTGTARVTVPSLPGQAGAMDAHVMIRSVGEEGCFFFDLESFVDWHNLEAPPTVSPTSSPSSAPTTAAPTASPTVNDGWEEYLKEVNFCKRNSKRKARCEKKKRKEKNAKGKVRKVKRCVFDSKAKKCTPTLAMPGESDSGRPDCSTFGGPSRKDRKVCEKNGCEYVKETGACELASEKPVQDDVFCSTFGGPTRKDRKVCEKNGCEYVKETGACELVYDKPVQDDVFCGAFSGPTRKDRKVCEKNDCAYVKETGLCMSPEP